MTAPISATTCCGVRPCSATRVTSALRCSPPSVSTSGPWAFAVPVSSDYQHPPQVETTQECHQPQGGPVSPVKIVQDEQHQERSGQAR